VVRFNGVPNVAGRVREELAFGHLHSCALDGVQHVLLEIKGGGGCFAVDQKREKIDSTSKGRANRPMLNVLSASDGLKSTNPKVPEVNSSVLGGGWLAEIPTKIRFSGN
jgi:hypothetical protein